jgi:hypothetical protein
MARSSRALVLVMVAMAVSAPVSAALFTVTLTNGTTFSGRYKPRDATFDTQKVVFLDETGNLISIAKSDIESIESDLDSKGFGHMLDDTTFAFGWAPNDRGEYDPNQPIATSDVQSNEPAEPIYNVNESPSMPVFYTVPTDSVAPMTVVAPPAPVQNSEPPPGQ